MMELMRKAMLSKVSDHTQSGITSPMLPMLTPNKSVKPNSFDNSPLVEK